MRVIERQDRGKNCPTAIFTPGQIDVALGLLGLGCFLGCRCRKPVSNQFGENWGALKSANPSATWLAAAVGMVFAVSVARGDTQKNLIVHNVLMFGERFGKQKAKEKNKKSRNPPYRLTQKYYLRFFFEIIIFENYEFHA